MYQTIFFFKILSHNIERTIECTNFTHFSPRLFLAVHGRVRYPQHGLAGEESINMCTYFKSNLCTCIAETQLLRS